MSAVDDARAAFEARQWTAAVEGFEPLLADAEATLGADDAERLAVAAYLTGRDGLCTAAFERAHRRRLDDGDIDGAVRCGFWVGFTHMIRGDMAHAGGWIGQMGGLVDEHDPPGPGRGYLLIPAALRAIDAHALDDAVGLVRAAGELAQAHGDPDLAAFAALGAGQALIRGDDPAAGTARFDEVMVTATSGQISPIICGIVYCAVIDECVKLLDVRRAAEWTETLTAWCADQPDLVPYRGQCLVHRSQMMQLNGAWVDAAAEAQRARARLADPPHPALGLACYQQGELRRLRGEHAEAEEAYRSASEHGHEPMPGLPLLRLAQGRLDAAVAGIARALTEPPGLNRASLLAAAVEIHGAAGDLAEAEQACVELAEMAGERDIPVLSALAAHAEGLVTRIEGDAAAAFAPLREALALWRDLEMPYEAARTREQIGLACRAVGDHDGCDLELSAARLAFAELGAVTDLARLDDEDDEPASDEGVRAGRAGAGGAGGTGAEGAGGPGGDLTERELEVLRLVASGGTNREIGDDLVISEHTVARHVQNIFAKIGVSSRAAATSYAYEHDLV